MRNKWRIYKCLCGHCVAKPWKSSPIIGSGFRAFETYQEAVDHFIDRTARQGDTK